MTVERLTVTLPGAEVGALTMNEHGLITWTPDRDWEEARQRPRLGVDFLRKPGATATSTGVLPAWFENLLPEPGSALRERLCSAHQVRSADSFGLLKMIGGDLSGAVEVRGRGEARAQPVGSGGSASGGTSELEAKLRFSLAGMQLKFSMSMINDRLALGASDGGAQWIVKLPGSQYPELPSVETATMTWAKNAGFDVPEHFVVETSALEGIPQSWTAEIPLAFAVRRFDRRDDGSKVHHEDLCQVLNLLPSAKYGGVGAVQVTFDGLLRLINDVAGEASAREAAQRLGFVIASGNDDMHLKNWSLLWGNAERPGLTPCYDLVSTVSWRDKHGWGVSGGPQLALSVGRAKRFARLQAQTLDILSAKSSLSWAATEVLAGIERAKDAFSSSRPEMPELMIHALETHWQNVPLLYDFGRLPH